MQKSWSDRCVRFRHFVLDGRLRELRGADGPIALPRTPMALLWYLIEHRDRVVPGRELLDQVWPDTYVGDQALSGALRELRRALGDRDHELIQTLRGHGYRFTPDVAELDDAAPAPARHESPTREGARPASAGSGFVGRGDELERIERALEGCRLGRGGALLLRGPAGIGKSRLAEEASGRAAAADWAVHRSHCLSGRSAPPLWPWMQLARSCVSSAPRGEVRDDWLLGTSPAIGLVLSDRGDLALEGRPLDPSRAAFEIARDLIDLVGAAAGARPRLLVCEDLHWADPDSLEILKLFLQGISDFPVFVLATTRQDEVQDPVATELRRIAAAVRRLPRGDVLELAGLDAAAVRALLAYEGSPPSDGLVARVLKVSEGNALFVTELARLHRDGRLQPGSAGEESRDVPLPPAIADALMLQLADSSAACERALRWACVAGDGVASVELARVTGLAHEPLLDALSEAERCGVLRESSERPGSYAFRHSLFRELLYSKLTQTDRRRMHEDVACAIEALYAHDLTPRYPALARHFAEAAPIGSARRAAEYAKRAGEEAERRWAMGDAAELYGLGIAALEFADESTARLRAELHLARARIAARRARDATLTRAELSNAERFARQAGSSDLLARALLGQVEFELEPALIDSGVMQMPEGFRERLAPLLAEARAVAGPSDGAARARIAVCDAYLRHFEGDAPGRKKALGEAEAEAEAVGDRQLVYDILIARWWLTQAPDELDERRALADQLRRVHVPGTFAPWELSRWRVLCEVETGGFETADALMALARREARQLERHDPVAGLWTVMRATLAGDFAEATRHANQLSRFDAFFVHMARAAQLTWIEVLQGRTEQALPSIETLLRSLPETTFGSLVLAHCYAELGRTEAARAALARVIAQIPHDLPFGRDWILTVALAAETCAAVNETAHLDRIYRALLPYEDRAIMGGWFVACWGVVSRPLGLAALALGETDTAVAHLERALLRHEKLGARPLAAQSHLDLARARAATGSRADRRAARDHATRARELARALGMRQIEHDALRLLEEAEPTA